MDIVMPFLRQLDTQQVYRVRFSSVARRDIIRSFETIADYPNKNESLSVDARQIIDLKVGVAFSRFQSLYLKKKFQNLNQKMITFGPCQTPTLNFCVERHQEIINFIPKTYYKIDCKLNYKEGEAWMLAWEKESSTSREEAELVKQQVRESGSLQVCSVTCKEATRSRPEGMNTIQLLKHCSAGLGIGPNDAMNLAEKLYLGGFITYPRTETTCYSPNFDFQGILSSLAKSCSQIGEYSAHLLQFGFSVPKSGIDAGDHPPIIPTHKVPTKGFLPGNEGRLYDYICRHFLSTISRDASLLKTKVIFESAGHLFSLSGTAIIDPGFIAITPWVKLSSKIIPLFEKGEKYQLDELTISENQTTAPNYLSESELMSLMENNGIGTDASMATHINNICQRNFVEVLTRTRRLKPTPLGNALIQGYKAIDPELISAELRSNIEKNVDLIAKGKKDIDSVLSSVLTIFKQKYEYFRSNISKLEVTFVQVYGTFLDSLKRGIPFSYCGRCSQKMVLVEDFNKIYCKTCKLTLNLPRDAKYSLENCETCPLDGYQIINYYIRREGLETHLKCCPQCYHKSPNPEISHRLICSQCPHETCSASANNSLVSSCPKCRKGSLILNRPINRSFLLTCNHNKCHHTLSVVQSAVEVKRSKNKCLKCSAFKLLVSSNDEIYAANSTDYIESCVFCDDRFAPYIFDPREIGQLRQEPSDQYTRQESRTIERPDSHPLRDRLNIRPEVNHLRLFEKPKQGVTYGFRSGQTSGADPIQRREAKRKINQGIKNIKGQPNNEVDFNENRGIMEAPREFNRYNDHFQFLKFDKPYMARKERQEEGLSQHRMREEEAKEFHQQSNDDLHSEPMKLEQTDESKMCLVNLPKEEKNCLVEYQVDRSEK